MTCSSLRVLILHQLTKHPEQVRRLSCFGEFKTLGQVKNLLESSNLEQVHALEAKISGKAVIEVGAVQRQALEPVPEWAIWIDGS